MDGPAPEDEAAVRPPSVRVHVPLDALLTKPTPIRAAKRRALATRIRSERTITPASASAAKITLQSTNSKKSARSLGTRRPQDSYAGRSAAEGLENSGGGRDPDDPLLPLVVVVVLSSTSPSSSCGLELLVGMQCRRRRFPNGWQ